MARPRVAGAVLIGGASRRMGRDKAVIEVDGVAMARRVAAALAAGGCAPLFAVGGRPAAGVEFGLDGVADLWPGEGPLGAIITVQAHVATFDAGAWTLVAACDLPFLDSATVAGLVEAAQSAVDVDAVVARASRVEPLCAVWAPSAAAVLRAAFAGGERSVTATLIRVRVTTLDVEMNAVRNINTPGDLP